jgi:tRNA A37 N6-isopentenylltransferase MiaA
VLFWIRNDDKVELHSMMRNRIGKMVMEGGLAETLAVMKFAEMRGLLEGMKMGALTSIGYKEFADVYRDVK